jgi:hypothetical protein
LGNECSLTGPEPACGISAGIVKKAVRDWINGDHQNYWKSLTGLKHAERFLQGPLYQKNQGTAKTKQKPVTVHDRSIYRTLSPERTPLQNGIVE